MGCDIHCAIEYKGDGGDWCTLYGSVLSLPRHYKIFAKLANVRNGSGVTPIDSPRGFPEDAEKMCVIRQDHAKHGRHSESWCTVKEFKRIFTDSDMSGFDDTGDYDVTKQTAPEYWAVYKSMKALEKAGYDVRFVFYFDS